MDSWSINVSLNLLLVFRLGYVESLHSVFGLDDLPIDVSVNYALDTCFNILW